MFAQVVERGCGAGCAPPVLLDATNEKALDVVSLADLEYHAGRRIGNVMATCTTKH